MKDNLEQNSDLQQERKKNVKAKSGLNYAILDTAPSMFVEKLEYKVKQTERTVAKVAKYTSLIFSECGHKSQRKESRRTQSKFWCCNCGIELNADVNGAKNILARVIASSCQRGIQVRAQAKNPPDL